MWLAAVICQRTRSSGLHIGFHDIAIFEVPGSIPGRVNVESYLHCHVSGFRNTSAIVTLRSGKANKYLTYKRGMLVRGTFVHQVLNLLLSILKNLIKVNEILKSLKLSENEKRRHLSPGTQIVRPDK